jgi:uncharacterized protein YndB with AHSA1/START domain
MTGPSGDGARVTVRVAVAPDEAFAVFTSEIDRWWRHGARFRIAGRRPGRIAFTPGVGGNLTETVETAAGTRTFLVGKVTAWEPPARLAFEWRGVNFAGDEKTTVEVTFTACGDGTMVTLHHRGWSSLRRGHPARHGQEGAEFSRWIGQWWGDLMTALREHVATKKG